MPDIEQGYFYVTTGTISSNTITGGTTVKIWATKIDHNYDNQLSEVPIPVSKGSRTELQNNSQVPYTLVIDLKRTKEAVTVQGFLPDEAGEAAETKKNNLITLAKTNGALKIVWNRVYGTNNYQTKWEPNDNPNVGTGVFVSKFQVTETAGLIGEAVGGASNQEPGERNLAINITFIRGKDM